VDEQLEQEQDVKTRRDREREELEQTWLAEQVQLVAIEDGFDS
jgi:hypothetical protein